MESVTPEQIEIFARDGQRLVATLFQTDDDCSPKKTVVIASATGVPQSYYQYFAKFLAAAGFDVVTFDFRTTGLSPVADIKKSDANFITWGNLDFPAVIEDCAKRWPDQSIEVVGHSGGGWLIALNPSHDKISALYAVASGSVYWRLMGKPDRYFLYLMWKVLIPVVTAIFGYAPAWLGLKMDLTASHARQWARWSLSPNAMFDDPAIRAIDYSLDFKGRITAVDIFDDHWETKPAVQDMFDRFSNANVQYAHVTETDVHGARVGHFGFFRKKFQDLLWQKVLKSLLAE